MSGLTFVDDQFQLHDRGGNTVNYQVARQDSVGDTQYNAWIAADGSFIIMERNLTDRNDITNKYVRFDSSATFQTEWDNRTGQTYLEYNELFT